MWWVIALIIFWAVLFGVGFSGILERQPPVIPVDLERNEAINAAWDELKELCPAAEQWHPHLPQHTRGLGAYEPTWMLDRLERYERQNKRMRRAI